MKLPKSISSLIWWAKADPVKDKTRIITSVMNYGSFKQLGWIVKHYSQQEVKETLENPLRGVWDEKSLILYLKLFKVKTQQKKIQKALQKINIGSL